MEIIMCIKPLCSDLFSDNSKLEYELYHRLCEVGAQGFKVPR